MTSIVSIDILFQPGKIRIVTYMSKISRGHIKKLMQFLGIINNSRVKQASHDLVFLPLRPIIRVYYSSFRVCNINAITRLFIFPFFSSFFFFQKHCTRRKTVQAGSAAIQLP